MTKNYTIIDPMWGVPTLIWKDDYCWRIWGQDNQAHPLKLSLWEIQELINKEKI